LRICAERNDEISFLRAHIYQLSDKITPALPPSEEEIKAKRWWQFWRRGLIWIGTPFFF
jgi:hypothetical protein